METVLVVNADPLERNLVTRYLTSAGYHVFEAATTDEAVRIRDVCEGELDLIVVPYSGDTNILTEICSSETTVALLLTSSEPEQILQNFRPPVPRIAFLQRPFSPAALISKVRDVLSN
jgi:two-component system cell cycle sensor histidine kinase/response regulator CckA